LCGSPNRPTAHGFRWKPSLPPIEGAGRLTGIGTLGLMSEAVRTGSQGVGGASEARGQGPMHASLNLGRLAGVDVGINWSWLVILALISASLGFAVFPTTNPGYADGVYATMAVAAALLFFVSLLLHELGHAVVARREGMEIEGIVLWLFGGWPSSGGSSRQPGPSCASRWPVRLSASLSG
jgi:hypothetical protein